jgi:hypothetical protein
MVTAVTFSPDARLIVAGLLNGTCTFYLTEGMRYLTQVRDGVALHACHCEHCRWLEQALDSRGIHEMLYAT